MAKAADFHLMTTYEIATVLTARNTRSAAPTQQR